MKNEYAKLAKNYKEICELSFDPEWYGKNYYLITLPSGLVLEEKKPSIRTRFCYGAGRYGVSTEKEDIEAEKMAEYAKSSTEYFVKRNLQDIRGKIDYAKKCKDLISLYKDKSDTFYAYHMPYIGQCKTSGVCVLTCLKPDYPVFKTDLESGLYHRVTAADLEVIIKFYESIAEQFAKRLNAYLKRYGMSKVETWTYICD